MKKHLYFFASRGLLLGLLLFGTACSEDDVVENPTLPRLLIETGRGGGRDAGSRVTLPGGKSISVRREPLIAEFEVVNAEVVEVDSGRKALLLELNSAGARKLYRATVSNMGGRIVLAVNGNPVGVRRIDGPIQDGNFYTFVEMSDSALEEMVREMKESLNEVQKNLD